MYYCLSGFDLPSTLRKVVKFPSAHALSDSASLAEMPLCHFLRRYLYYSPGKACPAAAVPHGAGEERVLVPSPRPGDAAGSMAPASSAAGKQPWDQAPLLPCHKVFWGESPGKKSTGLIARDKAWLTQLFKHTLDLQGFCPVQSIFGKDSVSPPADCKRPLGLRVPVRQKITHLYSRKSEAEGCCPPPN